MPTNQKVRGSNPLQRATKRIRKYVSFFLFGILQGIRKGVRRGASNTICRKLDFASAFHFFTACGRQPDKALQKQKSIRNLCIFGAEQFKTSRFLLKQGIKSSPYCRMDSILNAVSAERYRFKPYRVRLPSP